MMVRAEVVLVCAQTGIDAGLVSGDVLTYICVIIILSSFVAPLLLKLLCRHDAKKDGEKQIKEEKNIEQQV